MHFYGIPPLGKILERTHCYDRSITGCPLSGSPRSIILLPGGTIMIQVEHVNKTYKVARRSAGFSEAVRALFSQRSGIRPCVKRHHLHHRRRGDGRLHRPQRRRKKLHHQNLKRNTDSRQRNVPHRRPGPLEGTKEHVKEIGVVFGQRSQLWWDVPVIDSFELLRDIYEIPRHITKMHSTNL